MNTSLHQNVALVFLAGADRVLRRRLSRALERSGCEVIESEDGLELDAFVDWHPRGARSTVSPDAIISDVRSASSQCLEVLRRFRSRNPLTSVVLIVDGADPEGSKAVFEIGADAVLGPDLDEEDLGKQIRELVARRHRLH